MAIPNGQINSGDIVTTLAKRKFHVRRDFEIEDLIALADSHYGMATNYELLYDYYKGNHFAIQNRTFDDTNKPNNRVVHNFPKLIVDTSVAYLVGEPVTYAGDEATIKAMEPIFKKNFIDDLNSEEAKFASIFGHCFEIAFINGDGELELKVVSPKNCFMVYSMDLEEAPLAAVYYNQFLAPDGSGFTRVYEVFTENSKWSFTTEKLAKANSTPSIHQFTEVPNALRKFPVFELVANEERLGDFEAQISLVDAYNLAVSDSVNDIAYWNDAYLWLQGFDISEDGSAISNMKNDKVIVTDENGNVKFVTKDVNDKHIENIKDRAKEDIFSLSQTPDLASPSFTAASGVAMRARSQPLENKTAIKESKFKKLLQHRFELICEYLKISKPTAGSSLSPENVEGVFVRNLPQSYSELADMALKMKDTMSDETILAQFPFVTNPANEVKKADSQRKKRIKDSGTAFGVPNLGASKALNNDPSKNVGISTTSGETVAKGQEKARNQSAEKASVPN